MVIDIVKTHISCIVYAQRVTSQRLHILRKDLYTEVQVKLLVITVRLNQEKTMLPKGCMSRTLSGPLA